jgi:hypothetical protein
MSRIASGFLVSAALLMNTASYAAGTPVEMQLSQVWPALQYCLNGEMPKNDIAYITGSRGAAQYGRGSDCKQKAPTAKTRVLNALTVAGQDVSECKLASAKAAVAFCKSGGMQDHGIAYIAGRTGNAVFGPFYGCVVQPYGRTITNAICK